MEFRQATLPIIYVELRALFLPYKINDHFSSFCSEETQTRDHFSEKFFIGLRTRHLDNSARNLMVEDIISKLFPHFAKEENKQKISSLSKHFRRSFDGWRSELWSNIVSAYQNSNSNSNNSISKFRSSLKVSTIFRQWLTSVSNELSEEMEKALQNVVMYGIICLIENDDKSARSKFFMANVDLYTINWTLLVRIK